LKTLIAEDDKICRMIMQKLVQDYGPFEIAENGRIALDAYTRAMEENTPFDLILLDLMMPEMTGHEVLKSIRTYEEEKGIDQQNRVKIVMTSALSDTENTYKAFGALCDGYIVKPIEMEDAIGQLRALGFNIDYLQN